MHVNTVLTDLPQMAHLACSSCKNRKRFMTFHSITNIIIADIHLFCFGARSQELSDSPLKLSQKHKS